MWRYLKFEILQDLKVEMTVNMSAEVQKGSKINIAGSDEF